MKNIKKKNKIVYFAIISIVIIAMTIALFILRVPSRAINKIKSICYNDVTVYEEKIDIEGLEEPFKIVFIADAHIALVDSRDLEVKDISEERYKEFVRDSKGADRNFSILMKKVREENPNLVIFGGDITDAATYASIEYVKNEIDKLECPYVYCMGNHDFMYGDEYFTEKAYSEYRTRFDSFDTVQNECELIEYDKFAIIVADDCNNQISANIENVIQHAKETGKPLIVATHVPFVPTIDGGELIRASNEVWGCAYLDYSRVLMGDHANMPNENTAKIIEYVSKEENNVSMVLAGHIHFYHRDYMNKSTCQVTAPGAYERAYVKVTLY